MNYWKELIVVSLGSGVISSLSTVYLRWGVEKKRMKLMKRRDAIEQWRIRIENDFDDNTFRETVEFSQMKEHLSEKMEKELNPHDVVEGKHVITLRACIGRDILKDRLLEEVAGIEKKWGLI